jgi:hypothetical protein
MYLPQYVSRDVTTDDDPPRQISLVDTNDPVVWLTDASEEVQDRVLL